MSCLVSRIAFTLRYSRGKLSDTVSSASSTRKTWTFRYLIIIKVHLSYFNSKLSRGNLQYRKPQIRWGWHAKGEIDVDDSLKMCFDESITRFAASNSKLIPVLCNKVSWYMKLNSPFGWSNLYLASSEWKLQNFTNALGCWYQTHYFLDVCLPYLSTRFVDENILWYRMVQLKSEPILIKIYLCADGGKKESSYLNQLMRVLNQLSHSIPSIIRFWLCPPFSPDFYVAHEDQRHDW